MISRRDDEFARGSRFKLSVYMLKRLLCHKAVIEKVAGDDDHIDLLRLCIKNY